MPHHPRIPVVRVYKLHCHKSIWLSIRVVDARHIKLVTSRNAMQLHYEIRSYWFGCGRYLQTLISPRRWSLQQLYVSREKWTAHFVATGDEKYIILRIKFFILNCSIMALYSNGGFTILTHIMLSSFQNQPSTVV